MLIGLGTQHAKDELREFIEAAKIPVIHITAKQSYLTIILIVLVT